MKRGFTLMELLVVIGIMALMGSVTVAGYRQMKRGMEERSVMQNANQFIRSAYQRAQIDRQPVAIYFWNETLQEETSDTPVVVVGRAVAVRRAGRITSVQGEKLCDEFGDLRFNSNMLDDDEEGVMQSSTSDGAGINFYQLNGNEGNNAAKSIVYETTVPYSVNEPLVLGGTAEFDLYAFELKDRGNVSWAVGDAYGFEFAEITLPHGYIFGTDFSKSLSSPVTGNKVIRFKVSANSGDGAMSGESGASTIQISSLRPDNTGAYSAQKVGTTQKPTDNLN